MSTDLDRALRQFEAAEANLNKLERLLSSIQGLIPSGVAFLGDSPEGILYEKSARSWSRLVASMPRIDSWELPDNLMALDDIAQSRFDAREVDEISAYTAVENAISQPGRDLREYRFRLDGKRRELIRTSLGELECEIDTLVASLKQQAATMKPGDSMAGESWEQLCTLLAQIDTLLGSSVPRPPRWSDLARHLHFGLVGDFRDIAQRDWPIVKRGLRGAMYHEDEPLPVEIEDLGEITAALPSGPVAVELRWGDLSEKDFERLLFCLIDQAPGYENPQWLTKTNAPDRGRDLSVERTREDSLCGTRRERVIVQCKHWLTKSVRPTDVSEARTCIELWEPPLVDVLVLATSGRFTTDAVDLLEKHNQVGKRPYIEMWPESHLERLLARQPGLIAEFRLR